MTDSKYKVTVGMPVYGVEKYIQKSLLSVLNQTYKNYFEILVKKSAKITAKKATFKSPRKSKNTQ